MHSKLWSREFIAIIASNLFASWAFYALLPTLPVYLLESLNMNHRSVGLVMAAFSVSIILVRPIAGYMVDNFHRSVVLISSLFIMTVGYGIYPLAGTLSSMLLIRFGQGAMFSISSSSSATIVADIVPSSRLGQGIGVYALSIPIGMTLGPMFGLELLQERGPNSMFLAILGISILSVLGAIGARPPFKPLKKKKFALPSLLNVKALPISLGMFFIMIAYGAIVVFVSIYAEQKDFSNIASFFACFSATIFLSRLFAGRLFDHGHIFLLILGGLTLAAVGLVWLGYAESPFQFLVAGMICGFGFGVLMPTGQAAINNLVESSERGGANSTYLFSYDLGVGIGSLVIGFLLDRISMGAVYRYSALLIAVSAGIFVVKAIPHYLHNRQDRGVTS